MSEKRGDLEGTTYAELIHVSSTYEWSNKWSLVEVMIIVCNAKPAGGVRSTTCLRVLILRDVEARLCQCSFDDTRGRSE